MKESEILEIVEGRYAKIRDIHAETLEMLGRATKDVADAEMAIELAEWIWVFSKSLLASDVTFRSETCGFSGGGGG